MNIEIYSKQMCPQCTQVKNMIKQKCLDYHEHILGKDTTVQELKDRVSASHSDKLVKSAPQVFVENVHIGEFKDAIQWISEQESGCPIPRLTAL